ncbi:MAG: EAL domain-containing protein [Pseudomonadota bacterium]
MWLSRLLPSTVRSRLLWLALLVQVLMLSILIGRAVVIFQEGLLGQVVNCEKRLTPALESALISPLLMEDVSSTKQILAHASRAPGVEYIAVTDLKGEIVAATGWSKKQELPQPTPPLKNFADGLLPRLNVVNDISIGEQKLAKLHYGLSLSYIETQRIDLLWQLALIAALAVVFTMLALRILGELLTQKLARVTAISEKVAQGEFVFKPLDEGRDDVGRMGAAFNTMASALQQKLSDIEHANALLTHEKEFLQVTLSSIGDGVMSFDLEGRVMFINPAAEALLGCKLGEVVGKQAEDVLKLVDGASEEPIENPVRRCLREHNLARLDANALLLTRDGRRLYVSDTVAPIRDADGGVSGVVLALQDVSAKREMLEEMHWQANHDSLTGLMNRHSFEAQLRQLIDMEREDASTCADHALMYIDLDQFKIVNDTSGHMAGDELLRQVTFLMQQSLRKSDVFARLGGDEFGVLLPDCPEERALSIAGHLREAVHDFRFVWQDKVFQVGVSIGLVMLNQSMYSVSEVLSAADVACYSAKEEGRNRVHVYRADDAAIVKRRAQMVVASSLREVMREDRFLLMLQEIRPVSVEAERSGIPHFEVLLRLRNDQGEIMPADSFIPAAERYGVMPHIDRWVVRHVLRRVSAMHAARPMHLAINLSGLSMIDPQMPEFIRTEIMTNHVDPRLICFEITETAAISYLSQAIDFMRQVQAIGCQFALDDFGSGMSSFGYLKNLPVQCLKIDGGFVRDMLTDSLDRILVESIHHIGKVMGMQIVAEYASSEAHVHALKEIGVDFVQGFAISRPRSMDEVLAELASENAISMPLSDLQSLTDGQSRDPADLAKNP